MTLIHGGPDGKLNGNNGKSVSPLKDQQTFVQAGRKGDID